MLESREFADAHIVFLHDQHIIFGVQQDGELSAFGGRSEQNETLFFTLLREYVEESHESIITAAQLSPLLSISPFLHYRKRGGKYSCTLFVQLPKFDFEAARAEFLTAHDMTHKHAYREMKDLFVLPLKEVIAKLQQNNRHWDHVSIRAPTFQTLKKALESSLLC